MSEPSTPREILARLAAFPTVSRAPNLDLVNWVEEWLDGHGIAAHRVWNADHAKAALYAHVGPEIPGGVVLSGHTDVVPVEGQVWASDPWVLTARGGVLCSRGAVDMKGFGALALSAMAEAAKGKLKRPPQIALSYDEEVGRTGAPPMIDAMVEHLPNAPAVIVGAPSRLKVVTGHKGSIGFATRANGYVVPSSIMHEGISAIHEAAPGAASRLSARPGGGLPPCQASDRIAKQRAVRGPAAHREHPCRGARDHAR
jgi:acetylornithine deacetylase